MLEYDGYRSIFHDQYMEAYFMGYTIGLIGVERHSQRTLLRLKRNVNVGLSEEAAKKIQDLEECIYSDEYKKDRFDFYDRYASLSNENMAKKIWKESEYWQGSNNLPI